MKAKFLLHFIIFMSMAISFKTSAQNADEIIFNQYMPQYNYVAASFIIDTGVSQANLQRRAFLIWANNLQQDSLKRNFSLSEYDGNLNFLTEQGSVAEKFGTVKNMFPKKIIKSKFERAYYLLAYVTSSRRTISGFKVYSSPVVYKIDANTLMLKWASKMNLAVLNADNVNTVIEYNDIIETRDKNIVLVGKYAGNIQAKESVLSTKLKGSSGALIWKYVYKTGNTCNEAANSVAETKDGNLSLTGYVKKCTTALNGNADVFYMQLQSTGVPVPGVYVRFTWPASLNAWGDKITCYTSSAGNDQLIISGYIDIQSVTGATNRQILVMNLKQNGNLVTAQHIGNTNIDVCNDLIFKKTSKSGTDYLVYLTGQTFTGQTNAIGQAYFMYGKLTTTGGVTGISEFSTFPNTLKTNGSLNGVEIKNAGDYKKFAILATGTYQPAAGGPDQTYSDVLLRDFNDTTGNCIKRQETLPTRFDIGQKIYTVAFDTPSLRVYRESWIKLGTLFTKERCQQIKIDPSHALALQSQNAGEVRSIQALRVSPNPAQSAITITTADGSALAGNSKSALIQIYNYAMQVEKIVRINEVQGKMLRIPVDQLKPGIYRIQLTRGNETLGCSFIKE
jgi:hypothetical protein